MRGRDRIALYACAATVVSSALMLGGAGRWPALATSALSIVAVIPYVTSRRTASQTSPVFWLILAAASISLFQLVPMPALLAEVIAKEKLSLLNENARAWGDGPATLVMASFDPPATLVELAKLCGYAAFTFLAARLAADRRTRRMLAMIVVGTAISVAAVAFAHEVIGVRSIYGLFNTTVRPRLTSPIINDNHLASLMGMAVPLALALSFISTGFRRVLWVGAIAVCAGVLLLTGSRGGALGLSVGLAATVVLLLLQRRDHAPPPDAQQRVRWLAWIVTATCIGALLVALTSSPLLSALQATQLEELQASGSKYQVWGQSLRMLAANPWLGIGRGAFEQAFTRWASVGQHAYSHAENSYLQTAVDWGIPSAIAMLLTTCVIVRRAFGRWRQSPLEAGALGALASLAIHEFVDFSIELPVIALALILVLSILLPARLALDAAAARLPRARRLRVASLAFAAGVCVLAASPHGRPARASAATVVGTPEQQLVRARVATAAHPSDYLLLGQAAQSLMLLGDPRAVPMITRALYLNPSHSGLHHVAAGILLRSQRPAQAQAEFALALEYAPGDGTALLREILTTFPEPDDAARALPLRLSAAPSLVTALLASHHELVGLAYTQRLAMLFPADAEAQFVLARSAMAANRLDLALPAANACVSVRGDAASQILLAKVMSAGGDASGAMDSLRTALALGQFAEGRMDMLLALAELQIPRDSIAATATLEELAKLATERRHRIAFHLLRASLHERLGEANQATLHRDLARKLQR